MAIILYGSLYPFEFHARPALGSPFHALILEWRVTADRADVISNLMLYFPLGLFFVLAIRRFPPIARVAMATVFGLALSMGMEMAQFYDRTRSPEMADVYANTAGTFLGAIAAGFFARLRRPFVALMLACWLGYRLYPYAPALRPLNFAAPISWLELYFQTTVWLAVALLLEAVAGENRLTLLWTALVVLLARVLMAPVPLPSTELLAALLAAVLWTALISRLPHRATIVAVLFASVVVVQALAPYHFRASARSFGWIPFLSLLNALRETAVRQFLEKAFMYGGLVWLLARAGLRISVATALGGALVLALRIAQVYLPGRSAEITDLVMLLLLAGTMKMLGEFSAAKPE